MSYGDPIGSLAMLGCELRQAWKGATVATDACAEVQLVGSPPNLPLYSLRFIRLFFFAPLMGYDSFFLGLGSQALVLILCAA